VGDIAAWGGHVEVVHAVNHAAGTFCSLGGYLNPLGTSRCGDVSPARRFDYKDIRFFRVRP